MSGLNTTKSDFSVSEAVHRINAQIEKEGWHVFAHINHATEARKRGLELRPTELILYGNPEIGTLLMQDCQRSAIDLPMKILIWEDEDGQAQITYNDLEWLKERHELTDNETINKITKIVERVCKA